VAVARKGGLAGHWTKLESSGIPLEVDSGRQKGARANSEGRSLSGHHSGGARPRIDLKGVEGRG
jgi:hypothetical protein